MMISLNLPSMIKLRALKENQLGDHAFPCGGCKEPVSELHARCRFDGYGLPLEQE
jgi:hypothetical protein